MTPGPERLAARARMGMADPRIVIAATITVGLVYVLASLATLTTFPLVWMDEPWYTQSAASFVTEVARTCSRSRHRSKRWASTPSPHASPR
jgi:hypothetical protein